MFMTVLHCLMWYFYSVPLLCATSVLLLEMRCKKERRKDGKEMEERAP